MCSSNAGIDKETWGELIDAVREYRCTPFLGAGVNVPKLPTGKDLARTLATIWDYPLDDSEDLMRVCQYRAVMRGASFRPKKEVSDHLRTYLKTPPAEVTPERCAEVDGNYRKLAALRAPIYVTTNYDDLLHQALRADRQQVCAEYCRWHQDLIDKPLLADDEPQSGAPWVYHLHGTWDLPKSMVLTETDYTTFLARLTDELEIIPPRIREALSDTVVLFIGYSLSDWNFRVIHRVLSRRDETGGNPGVAVQLPPMKDAQRQARVQEYLERYFDDWNIKVFWGTSTDFLEQLSQRLRSQT